MQVARDQKLSTVIEYAVLTSPAFGAHVSCLEPRCTMQRRAGYELCWWERALPGDCVNWAGRRSRSMREASNSVDKDRIAPTELGKRSALQILRYKRKRRTSI